MLAALLVRPDRPISADALIEAVWGTSLPASPRDALHTLLSRLRAKVGGETIRSGPTGFRLDADPAAVDAARFEALQARSRGAPTRQAMDLLDRGLGLWRGPAFVEFADRDFATAEAVRLDELRDVCIEERAALRLDVGDTGRAIPSLEAFVEDPRRRCATSNRTSSRTTTCPRPMRLRSNGPAPRRRGWRPARRSWGGTTTWLRSSTCCNGDGW